MQHLRDSHRAGVQCPQCGRGMTAAPLHVVREVVNRYITRLKIPAMARTLALSNLTEETAQDARVPYCGTCHHVIERGLP